MRAVRGKRRLSVALVVASIAVMQAPASAVLEPSGHPTTAFGGDGASQTNFALVDTFAEARGLGIQNIGARAGQIVVAGGYQDGFDSHIALLRLNADGTQDMGFGAGGEVKTTVGGNDLAEDVVIQPDDKIVVAGFSDNSAMVVRYLPDGAIDTSFGGGDGILTFQVLAGEQTRLQSVILQPDGKILVVGGAIVTPQLPDPDPTPNDGLYQIPSDRAALVARINTNGTIDTTFGGGDGYATINITVPGQIQGFPDPLPDVPSRGGNDDADGIALQADGKIVWVGRTNNENGTPCKFEPLYTDGESVIGRLNANGTPDTSFDGDGHRVLNLATVSDCRDDAFRNVTVQPDGRIVAVGSAATAADGSQNAKQNFSVARFNTDGSFDNTFDADGRLSTQLTTGFLFDGADDVVVLPGGDLLVGGNSDQGGQAPGPCCTFASEFDFAAIRYNSDGSLDTGFAGDGSGNYDFSQNDTFDTMVVDGSGRPILAGYSYVVGSNLDPLISVARIGTDGVLDPTFNAGGNPPGTFFKKLQGGSVDLGAGIGRQAVGANAGKVVVVGSTDTGTASGTDVGLVRYTTTGALDSTFAGDGKATGSDGSRSDSPGAVAIQPDDKIVVAGTSFGTSGSPNATLMRFTADGSLDGTFGGGDGIATLSVGSNANQWDAVALAPDGDIYVAGAVSSSAPAWDVFVARYNPNGTIDTGFSGDGWYSISLGAGVDQAYALAVQPDGKVLVGGSTFVGQTSQFALLRLNAAGTPDATFGGGDGIVTTAIGAGQFPRNEITGIAVQSDGRIVVGGNGNDGGGNTNNVIRLARYTAAGVLDPSFDGDGIVTTNLAGDRFDRVGGIGLQRDDKVVVFGYTQQLFVTRDDFVIARYNWDDGSLDTTYGDTNAGRTILAASGGSDQAAGGVIFPDGSAAIGGTVGSSDLGAARFAGDPAPVTPGAPALATASDSGASNSDRITNDNTPDFLGTPCNVGETTIIEVDGTATTPPSRALCRTGSYAVTTSTLADGVHTINAFSRNGAGDSADTATTSVTIDTTANPPTITTPAANAIVDAPPNVTIAGTVDETIPGAIVTVSEAGQPVCTAVADAAGAWSCVAALLAGPHSVTARQLDIAGNTSNESGAHPFGVRVETSTALTSSVDPSVYGETITFTATVTATDGSTPTGDVAFVIDGGAPETATLDASGVATLTVPNPPDDPLDVGEHPVTASFLGSTYYKASGDDLDDDQTVEPADTTVSVSATPASPSPYGADVTFTFTAVPTAPGAGTPTGSITASVGGGTPEVLPLVNGQATVTRSGLVPGSYAVTATYGGEPRFNPSPEATASHEVARGASQTTVASTPSPSSFGEAVTFTATVTGLAPAPGAPEGTVSFTIDGGSPVVVPIEGGVASTTTATLGAGNHTVTATYDGSALFEGSSDSLDAGHVVEQGASTTAIAVAPTPSVFGQSTTITVTATPEAPASGALSGPGTLVIDGGTPIDLTFVDGVATHTTDDLPVGTRTLDATFGGTPDVAGSAATQVSHVVDQASTSTSVSAAPNPSTFGALVTFTATVAPVAPGAGVPTGTVRFVIDSGPPVDVALVDGVAELDSDELTATTHTVTASYLGDTSFAPSSGDLDGGQVVGRAASTTTITSSTNPSGYGEPVTFHVGVAPVAPSTTTPTGSIQLVVDGTVHSTADLVAGAHDFVVPDLPVGTHVVEAVYGGDADHAGSDAPLAADQVVEKGASTTELTSSAASTTFGQAATFTATVAGVAPAPGTPTGSVTFVIDGGDPTEVPLVAGVAELETSSLPAGVHTVTATYAGDGSFDGSDAGAGLDHEVEPAATATAVTSSADPSRYGKPLTFTVTVTAADSTPTGAVELTVGDDAPVTLDLVDGTATLVRNDLPVGDHAVEATYLPDDDHLASNGALAEDQTVQRARPRVRIDLAPRPPVAGQPFTITVTIDNPDDAGVAAAGDVRAAAVEGPTGTVTLTIDGVVGSPLVLAAGTASQAVTLPAGAHTVEVTYSGDLNHEGLIETFAGADAVVVEAAAATRPGGTGTGTVGSGGRTGSGGSGLPRSGSDVAPALAASLLLLVAGSLLLETRRRRRPEPAHVRRP